MRKIIYIILIIILAKSMLAQSSWQWQNPKPLGDPINQILFIDNQVGWILPENSTIMKTTNGGKSWGTIYTNIYFDRLFFIGRNEGWAVGREHYVPEYYNSVYHTTDGGLNWEKQQLDSLINNVSNIYFLDKDHGWIGGSFSNYYSTKDGGKHWSAAVLNDYPFAREVSGMLFVDTLKGWAVGDSPYGLKTTDGGRSWERDSSLGGIHYLIELDSHNIWAYNWGTIKKTTDGGLHWITVKLNQPDERNTDLYVQDSSRIFLSTDQAFYETTDGGGTWQKNSDEALNGFSVVNGNEIWGGGTVNTQISKLIHSINQGQSWTDLVTTINPIGFLSLEDVDFTDKQTGWIITHLDNRILRTTDGGNSWSEQNIEGSDWLWDIDMVDNELGYVVGNKGEIFKTTNGGTDWLNQKSGTTYDLSKACFITGSEGWVVGGTTSDFSGIVLKTTDGGKNWVKQTPSNTPRLISVSFIDSLRGWVISGGGSASDHAEILRTIDGGNNWTVQDWGSQYDLRGIFFINARRGFLLGNITGGGYGVYLTNDGGNTWKATYLGSSTLYDIKFINNDIGFIVGACGRIYKTNDSGATWNAQPSYTSQNLRGIDFADEKNVWVVGFYGTILHTTDDGISFIGNNIKNKLPESFILYQNFPNPFNPTTKIQYELQKPGFVTLKIYDLLGREVISLVNEEQNTGEYTVGFNASCLSTGIYFYKLRVNDLISVRKMILLK